MDGVWYTAIILAFALGLALIYARYRAFGTHRPPRSDERVDATLAGEHAGALGQPASKQPGAGQPVVADAQSVGLDPAPLRAAAEMEADSIRRTARSELQAARADAAATRSKAEGEAAATLADARRTARAEADRLTDEASRAHGEAQRSRDDAQREHLESQRAAEEAQRRHDTLELREAKLAAQESELDRQVGSLQQRRADLEEVEQTLREREQDLSGRVVEHQRELERVSGLSAEQARAELMTGVEVSARRDAAVLARGIEDEARAESTERARAIVAEAVQRVASEQTSESVVSVLHLPGDEMKGRIIGREGRNIRAFEAITGVNVIIDDTPEAVLLSCFDPVRREIGRLTLDKLVLDGRIHPQRIEDVYEQSRAEVDELCRRAAKDALAEVGIHDLDERLIPTLGRLKYRTSYGQNVLGHLLETAHIAGVMAAELGVEPTLVKRCAFLHDIGKALTHEVEGSHAIVGAELLRKYGESEAVAHAVEAHHNEVQPRTVEAVLTQASDTCSAARPGARRESLENYVKRLARIEEIATAKDGVDKVFAMQSGREVRVMVQPTEVDDLAAQVLAREIAKQIEDELTYPGQIRVTVVRESRSTEIAH